jgi:hypothetical protein
VRHLCRRNLQRSQTDSKKRQHHRLVHRAHLSCAKRLSMSFKPEVVRMLTMCRGQEGIPTIIPKVSTRRSIGTFHPYHGNFRYYSYCMTGPYAQRKLDNIIGWDRRKIRRDDL